MKTNNRSMTSCDRQRATAFLESGDYRLEDAELLQHLDTCSECREYMDSTAADGDVWQKLQQHLQPTEYDHSSSGDFSAATSIGPAAYRGETGSHYATIQDVLSSLAPTDDPHRLGRLGTYEITGVVGVGGMGVVLKAVDPSLDRVVAVKVMAPSLANNEKARKRFAREAKAAAAVLHPNVIPIHSVSSDASLPYLVMAYIRGGSLQKRLENEGALPIVEVLRIGSQIAAGLAAAHEQGLIHRDIKPENILLEEGVERVTITDFGLARAVDDNSVTQLGTIAGTPKYMSPEQARGEQLDQSSDLFSLGSVLYTLCTGRPPYNADSSYGVMRKIIDESPKALKEINPDIPDWMVGIVGKLMAKNKSDRFASALEVHRLLDLCLSHVQQPRTTPLPKELLNPNPKYSERRTLMKTSIAVILFGSLIGLLFQTGYFDWIVATNQKVKLQQEAEVLAPLSHLDSMLVAMMNSPHDQETVFLNLNGIGKDESYLCFKKIDDGMLVRLPAFDTMFQKRQGPYIDRFRKVAESLSIGIEEKSELTDDGKVRGINYILHVTGESPVVAATIRDITQQTFGVSGAEECVFNVSNMPSQYSVKDGESPKAVTAAEFIAEAKSGKRVYLGEQKNHIFLVPKDLESSTQLQWNQKLWTTDVRDLDFEVLQAIRDGSIR